MSQRNGDKSRFNRERKQNIHRRIRNRKLLQAAGVVVKSNAAEAKPVTTSAQKKNTGD